MKIIRGFKVRGFILAAAFVAGLGVATSASAQSHSYLIDLNNKTATDIGTLGGTDSEAFGINDAGQVVGGSDTAGGAHHAFITGPDGTGMRDLGTLGGTGYDYSVAYGINEAGQVVGWSGTAGGAGHAFITGANGVGMRDLGTLGGTDSKAFGINDAGQVVGYSETAGGAYRAFITGANGMDMRDLGTLGGTGYYDQSQAPGINDDQSQASGINDAGQVVGGSGTAGGTYHAFITGPNGMDMRDLGGSYAAASDINDAGQVVGGDGFGDERQAFITGANGMDMRHLSSLGGPNSGAWGINDAGQVVGESGAAGPGTLYVHAFMTGPDGAGMMDLNSLVHLPPGVVLQEAGGINNSGQVVAIGSIIPEPEIYTLFLSGLALVGFMARRKKMGKEIEAETFSLRVL